jgi:hypothetical protein
MSVAEVCVVRWSYSCSSVPESVPAEIDCWLAGTALAENAIPLPAKAVAGGCLPAKAVAGGAQMLCAQSAVLRGVVLERARKRPS